MHSSASNIAQSFVGVYSSDFPENYNVVEIGSRETSELRNIFNCSNYRGMDLDPGNNVDIVLTDPYTFPLEDESVDVLVSSSCFEHVPHFWSLFLEGIRVLKPSGLFYINAPSAGVVHRFPYDCWRFYPDSGDALVKWANKNGYNTTLLESFIFNVDPTWQDCVLVVLKDESHLNRYAKRIVDDKHDVSHIHRNPPLEKA